MTFRNVRGAVEKRVRILTENSRSDYKLSRAFTRFLDECFTEGKGLAFQTSFVNNNIIIQAPNKTAANELILKTADLTRILKEEKIVCMRIIIR